MKKIIDGKTYNTDTATLVGHCYDSSVPCGDFNYCEEQLFITKKGQFFIAGYGGALSKYSQPSGSNGSQGGSDITLLSPSEARGWCEKYQDYLEDGVYETYFPVEEG